ncbi:Cobalt/magnesium transport protein CorA [Anaerolineales bacterium]|nr:Cobalt/magnesium transport protein CorA [Anaerolineales bacterium]
MIRAIFFSPGKPARTDVTPVEFHRLLRDKRGLLWVDFTSEPPETSQPILESFNFHHLAIADALEQTHAPKIDDWGDYLYVVLNYMHLVKESEPWDTEIDELDIFLGRNYVITHHDNPVSSIDETWNASQRDPRYSQDGADHLLYKIIDAIVMDYMPIIEKIDDEIDMVEDQVFDRPSSQTLARLFTLKRVLLAMRRILLPQREVLNKMARDEYQVIDRKDRIFFRDIYDHLVRLHDINESLRDLVGGAMDTYLSVINNRLNDVMKTLTLITTLFMPISFITGFFGMNFLEPVAGLVGWTSRQTFTVMLGIMLGLPIVMYSWMRRRTWV